MTETKLCPDCPLKKYIIYLSQQSYTTTPNKKTALRTCQELRVIAKRYGEECKHYKGETLDTFLFFGVFFTQRLNITLHSLLCRGKLGEELNW